jgi:hypothetical protein
MVAHYIGKQFVGGGFPGQIGAETLDDAWAGGQLLDAQ